jgi:hypothetical protein
MATTRGCCANSRKVSQRVGVALHSVVGVDANSGVECVRLRRQLHRAATAFQIVANQNQSLHARLLRSKEYAARHSGYKSGWFRWQWVSVQRIAVSWRRGWDSNPRSPFWEDSRFRDGPVQPLRHLSESYGALGGIRTPDALLRTEALYPLSYEGENMARPEGLEPPTSRSATLRSIL